MGLASFLYQGELPSAEGLLDDAIKVLVRAEVDMDIDTEQSGKLIRGLIRAWSAVQTIESQENEDEECAALDSFDSHEDAYKEWHRVWIKSYTKSLGQAPSDPSELGWWPDALDADVWWPKKVVRRMASVIGAVEADRTRAMYAYFKEEEAKRNASKAALKENENGSL